MDWFARLNPVAVLAGLALVASGLVDIDLSRIGPPTLAGVSGWATIIFGFVALLYGAISSPDYSRSDRPLGIAIVAIVTMLSGVIIGIEGFVILLASLFFVLIGIFIIALGGGFAYLGKILWEGDHGGLRALTYLTIVSIPVGLIQVYFRLGNPILYIFQLWYLRRPHVLQYYEVSTRLKPWVPRSSLTGIPNSGSEWYKIPCQVCGSKNPPRTMYCFNCAMSTRNETPLTPASTPGEALEARLNRAEEALQKMEQLELRGKVVDKAIFEKARSAKASEVTMLTEALAQGKTDSPET